MKEVDVARPVVEELRSRGLDVYQEVLLGTSTTADIVVREQDSIWIIEAKTTLSWDLLAQANRRKNWASKVSIAIPSRRWKYATYEYVEWFLRKEGFGLIYVTEFGNTSTKIEPAKHDKVIWEKKLLKSLHPAQKDYIEAGTPGGGHWTPFKQTCAEVLKAVTAKPGLSAKGVVSAIEHHYASEKVAKSNLRKWARAGVIPGVEIKKQGRSALFFPSANTCVDEDAK